MRTLDEIRADFEIWAKNNKLNVFIAEDSDSLTSVLYSDSSDENLSKFKELVLQVASKMLILVPKNMAFEKSCYETQENWLKENDDNFDAHLSLLHTKGNDLVSLQIGFVHEGIYFYSFEVSDWHSDFENISKIILEIDIESEEDENELHNIPEEEEMKLIESITSSDEYIKASNISHRSDTANRKAEIYFEKNNYNFDFRAERLFVTKAENYFQQEIKPKRDLELKQQISSLKEQGLKKVQVASKLNVSIGIVNKFWEQI